MANISPSFVPLESIDSKPTYSQELKQKTEISGQLKSIRFQKDNFIIASILTKNKAEIIIKGNMFEPQYKLEYTFKGKWINHPKYGDSFSFYDYSASYPKELSALKEYIIENCKNVGESIGSRIIDTFGSKTLEICKNNPELLAEKIKGLTLGKAQIISLMLKQNETNEELSVKIKELTSGIGISHRAINTILALHKHDSVNIIKSSPYSLIDSIDGIGFVSADKIAKNVGFAMKSPYRIKSCVIHILKEGMQAGFSYIPLDILAGNVSSFLNERVDKQEDIVELEDIETQIDEMSKGENPLLIVDKQKVALYYLYKQEEYIANKLLELLKYKPEIPEKIDTEGLKEDQKFALNESLKNNLFVLRGSPGTGKTFLIKKLMDNLESSGKTIALAAPTGKASKRMYEMSGRPAQTIHKLLLPTKTIDGKFMFLRNEELPIQENVIIIDEVSMIPIPLMYSLLSAITPEKKLVLVGDNHQLPSIGSGNILKDCIDSGKIPTVELTEIKRQDAGLIINNCSRIKSGDNILIDNKSKDFFFIQRDTPEEIWDTIMELIIDRLPKKYGIDPLKDIQLLSPLREKTVLSCKSFNAGLQKTLNKNKLENKMKFKKLDKCIQLENNYELGMLNGDVGIINDIDIEEKKIYVNFSDPDRQVKIDLYDNKLDLAYCITSHKMQGSEADFVLLPISSIFGQFITQRNWLYTSVSRARRVCILVGSKKEVMNIINRNQQTKRYTNLLDFLTKKSLDKLQE